jgi:hypothetical protein
MSILIHNQPYSSKVNKNKDRQPLCFTEFIFLLLRPIFILLMPANRNALIRYKTIDKCLRNPYRRWTLKDLMDARSDALYETVQRKE